MLHSSLETLHADAMRQAIAAYGATWEIKGEQFSAQRGAMGRGMGGEQEEFIENFGGEVENPSSLFWITAIRSTFPVALLTERRVNFSQGSYLRCVDDGKDYVLHKIPDDIESPYLRFQLREP